MHTIKHRKELGIYCAKKFFGEKTFLRFFGKRGEKRPDNGNIKFNFEKK